ncbi:MAG: AAA family ATPase [Gammaproteobacteria bacterium]|nr:AAA family ATPase [Gammaproteobacteria bacterium]
MNAEIQSERRPLPIGYQALANLRNEGCYYVDKTPLIREMIQQGRFYFLSRRSLDLGWESQYTSGNRESCCKSIVQN